jgi:hypothetical protein
VRRKLGALIYGDRWAAGARGRGGYAGRSRFQGSARPSARLLLILKDARTALHVSTDQFSLYVSGALPVCINLTTN